MVLDMIQYLFQTALKTFGEMDLKDKMKIDHRCAAFKILNSIFFNLFY